MRRRLSLILAIMLLISCAGCFVGIDDDRRGFDNRDRGGHERDRHDEQRGHDEHR